MRICAGIDPGLDGGIAVLNESDTLETAFLPTMGEGSGRVLNGVALAFWMGERDVTEAIVEDVHAMPEQGIAGAFRLGRAVGQILGVLQSNHIPYTLVSPMRWKRYYGLLNSKKRGIVVDKDASRRLAIERFPKNAHQFARKMDIHRAEAALLARYQLDSGGASGWPQTAETDPAYRWRA